MWERRCLILEWDLLSLGTDAPVRTASWKEDEEVHHQIDIAAANGADDIPQKDPSKREDDLIKGGRPGLGNWAATPQNRRASATHQLAPLNPESHFSMPVGPDLGHNLARHAEILEFRPVDTHQASLMVLVQHSSKQIAKEILPSTRRSRLIVTNPILLSTQRISRAKEEDWQKSVKPDNMNFYKPEPTYLMQISKLKHWRKNLRNNKNLIRKRGAHMFVLKVIKAHVIAYKSFRLRPYRRLENKISKRFFNYKLRPTSSNRICKPISQSRENRQSTHQPKYVTLDSNLLDIRYIPLWRKWMSIRICRWIDFRNSIIKWPILIPEMFKFNNYSKRLRPWNKTVKTSLIDSLVSLISCMSLI